MPANSRWDLIRRLRVNVVSQSKYLARHNELRKLPSLDFRFLARLAATVWRYSNLDKQLLCCCRQLVASLMKLCSWATERAFRSLSKKQLSALIILTNVLAVQLVSLLVASASSQNSEACSVPCAAASLCNIGSVQRVMWICVTKTVWWEDTVFWDLTPCCLVEICLLFRRTRCFHPTAEVEIPRCYETSGFRTRLHGII